MLLLPLETQMAVYTDFDAEMLATSERAANKRVHFFKYVTVATAEIVLQNQTLRWSTPGHLNDPSDMQFDFRLEIDQAQAHRRALEQLWEVYSGNLFPGDTDLGRGTLLLRATRPNISKVEFTALFDDALKDAIALAINGLPNLNAELKKASQKCKVLCLTDRPNLATMWNHYADAHKGVVLRLRNIPAFDSPYMMARRVDYLNEFPQLGEQDDIVNWLSGMAPLDKAGILNKLIFTKTADWAYEREWRISSGDGRNRTDEPEAIPFNKHELDGLIFGKACPEDTRRRLVELAASFPNIELYEARITGLGMEIHTIPLGCGLFQVGDTGP
jgi:hypothetical protein